ncbi:hypothetical protein BDQ94DRAFT_180568 [Aspergillus welwitschiae]|uniref:Kinase-like domain-containing protein n=1 Tax=Aspergillus welwitschiae TaxID=1341132 RepID=A0A3F3PXY7_9EURO|nr:hypothetical protein BDQ94DRAFT_180568 [Aspergillus welwitschiae]RDH31196.1 hypothetical protein BDQ94DRAFT_180568 [Aspergillus welwitschiae]
MVPTVTLPYYASDIPCPLPTTSEIDAAAPNISLAYGGRRIVEIGEHSVVKFGKGVNLIEGENMVFCSARYIQQNDQQLFLKNSKVFLLFATTSDPSPSQPWTPPARESLDDDGMCTTVNSRLPWGSFPLHFRKMAVSALTYPLSVNEHLRLSECFLEFDVLALQNIVSTASGHSVSELVSFTKLSEGGFNRVFEATFSDGNTAPEHYTVYAWCSTKANPVGAEYIVMEKLDGTPLGNRWFSLAPKDQYKIMTQIVELETRLMSLKFPASGSLYYLKDLPSEKRTRLDDPNSMEFCIGPIAHYSWWHDERGIMDIDRGPWPSSIDLFRAAGERELTWAKAYAKPRLPYERLYREIYRFKCVSPDSHIADLPNNILVSDKNDIIGLNYGDPESEMLKQPQLNLPSDYDSMSPSEQTSIKEIHRRRVVHFLYAALTKRLNQDHYDAIFDQSVILRQRLFKSAGTPWEGDSVSLRAELIRSISNWSAIVQTTDVAPPVEYPEDVVRETFDLDMQQKEADVAMEQMRHALGVDVLGWVPNKGYEAARRLACDMRAQMFEAAETPDEVIAIRDHFPFDDFDERG